MRDHDGRNARGLSLVEVLISLTILVVALVAVFESLSVSIKGTERVREEVLATAMAGDLLGFLATLPVEALPRSTGAATGTVRVDLGSLASAFATPGQDPKVTRLVQQKVSKVIVPDSFTECVTIDHLPPVANGAGKLAQITVEVRWVATLAAGRRVNREVKLACLVTDDTVLRP